LHFLDIIISLQGMIDDEQIGILLSTFQVFPKALSGNLVFVYFDLLKALEGMHYLLL
jgi:hypothetical protein